MEEKIREIVSVFIRIPAEQIGPATAIDRSVMQSSILLHRMYARLSAEGVDVENYQAIRNYGDLVKAMGNGAVSNGQAAEIIRPATESTTVTVGTGIASGDEGSIGIDIEEVSALPLTNDFRKEAFYKMNFSAAEIAYCILQPDPYASFAGLFAVKEAIVKADAGYRGKNFNTILIGHSPEGRPVHPGFGLSISHAGGLAVAAAVPDKPAGLSYQGMRPGATEDLPAVKNSILFWLALLSLVLSVIALIIVLTR